MQHKLIAVILIVLAIYYLGANPAQSQTDVEPVASWRHLALTATDQDDPKTHRKVVELGADGWELVDVENFISAGETTKTVYYFKKPS